MIAAAQAVCLRTRRRRGAARQRVSATARSIRIGRPEATTHRVSVDEPGTLVRAGGTIDGRRRAPMSAVLLVCPRCRVVYETLGSLDSDEGDPRGGDVTVCVSCLAPLRFVTRLSLAVMSDEDVSALDGSKRATIRIAQELLRPVARVHGGRRSQVTN